MHQKIRSLVAALLRGLIQIWRYGISPVIGPRCRFHPSCSDYGLQALALHGPWRGSALTLRRVCRCHPWSPGGFDPVPERGPATLSVSSLASTSSSPPSAEGHSPER